MTRTFSLPKELAEEMALFEKTNWSKVVQLAIRDYMVAITRMNGQRLEPEVVYLTDFDGGNRHVGISVS